jgi:PAS domain S-box-containing protein
MTKKPSYEALEKMVKALENEVARLNRSEEALQKSEEMYRILVENALTGIYIDQGGQIVFANDQVADIYGYPREELIGKESSELVHPEHRPLTEKRRAERLKGEKPPSEYDAMGLTKHGETIWIRRRNTDIEYKGRPAILGNIVDITEKKQVREELKDFVHVVTHDLKTPVVAIHGFSERLLKNYSDEFDEKARSYIEHIMGSARRMDALVNDLRDLLKGGEVTSDIEDVSSEEVIKAVIKDLEDRLREEQVDLVVGSGLPTIRCDNQKLYQVFQNLVGNAIQYKGDTKTPKIEVGYQDRGDFHQFYVRDNGIGIDPKHQQKVFDKFERLRETEDEEGTGLGLAIVERIVRSHGGKVWVDSETNNGTTFYFYLHKDPAAGTSA